MLRHWQRWGQRPKGPVTCPIAWPVAVVEPYVWWRAACGYENPLWYSLLENKIADGTVSAPTLDAWTLGGGVAAFQTGGSRYFDLPADVASVVGGSSDFTVFFAAKNASNGADRTVWSAVKSSDETVFCRGRTKIVTFNSYRWELQVATPTLYVAQTGVVTGIRNPPQLASPYVVAMRFESGTLTAWANGVSGAPVAGAVTEGVGRGSLLAFSSAVRSNYFAGMLGEWIAWDEALSDSAIGLVNSYLQSRYGI